MPFRKPLAMAVSSKKLFGHFVYLLFMCMSVWPACMFLHYVHEVPRGHRSPGSGVIGSGEPPSGCWESNPGPLEVQPCTFNH